MLTETGGSGPTGATCPACQQPLKDRLRREDIQARGPRTNDNDPPLPVSVLYCGSCGSTVGINVTPLSEVSIGAAIEVVLPCDETTLEGQFQIRCRALITEVRVLGFDPFVWVDLINELGAVAAAKHILRNQVVLVVTRWLVERELPELTMEWEVRQTKWSGLFDDGDRDEAARRLARLERPGRPG